MTALLFADDAYRRACDATVTRVQGNAVELDQSVFYAQGGGQPGDSGTLTLPDGTTLAIANTVKGETPGQVLHLLADGATAPAPGTKVAVTLDWDRRHRLMRMHTALHLLSAVLPFPVTGGQVGDDKGRLDFDIPEATLDKDEIGAKLNALVVADHPVVSTWITDAELDARPDLVKTMAVQPPRGQGRVRLLKIGDGIDLQPCGGTHVQRTGEIGVLAVVKIEKKGRLNRRVTIAFA